VEIIQLIISELKEFGIREEFKNRLKHEAITINMGNRKINKKAFSGRGIKINEFAEAIHPLLLDEFDRLRKAGIRIELEIS